MNVLASIHHYWQQTMNIKNPNSSITHSQSQVSAVLGECDRDCKNMIPFLCGIVVLLVLNFVNAVPNKMVVMRYDFSHLV